MYNFYTFYLSLMVITRKNPEIITQKIMTKNSKNMGRKVIESQKKSAG